MNWNLDALYTSFDSEKFQIDMDTLKGYIPILNTWAEELNDKENVAEILVSYIENKTGVSSLSSRLGSYASLSFAVDSKNAAALKCLDQVRKITAEFTLPFTLFERYVKDLDELVFEEAIESSERLKNYRFHLQEIRHETKYMLSNEEEVLLAKLKQTGSSAWATLQNKVTSEMMIEVNVEGQVKKMPLQSVRNLASNADPQLRKDAYEAELSAYGTYESVSAAVLNAIKGEVITEAKLRGFKSPLHKTLVDSRMSQKTLDAMMAAIRQELPTFRKYLKKKAQYLGHKKGLPFYDLLAPMNGEEKEVSVEEAKETVLENFYGFSQELGDFAKKAMENEWLDILPKEGKRGGAFCSNIPSIRESRFLLNFTGYQKNVITMAHELGHGYHGEQIFKEELLNSSYPMPLAETASIFCETILKKALLKKAKPQEALCILEEAIQGYTQVIVDIYSRYLFETELFERREESSLTSDELKAMMLDAQKEAYGDGLDQDYLHPYMWMNKTHYYSAGRNFYNFPYAFGLLFARGLYRKYLELGDTFKEKYNQLLRETGKNTIESVAALMDIDVTDQAFWKASLDEIAQEIQQFVELTDEAMLNK